MRFLFPVGAGVLALVFVATVASRPQGNHAAETAGVSGPTASVSAAKTAEHHAAPAAGASQPTAKPAVAMTHAAPVPASPPPPAIVPVVATAAAAESTVGDPAQGAGVFRKCRSCHSMDAGKNLVGPSLAGIVGRKAGAEPNFNYSDAMRHAGIVWDAATLDAYLADPQKVVPGNRMPFPGLKSQHDREDVIAYLGAGSSGGAAAQATPAATPAMPAMPGMNHAAAPAATTSKPADTGPAAAAAAPPNGPVADVKYTLRSGIADGRMVFLGVGGSIDGQVNPTLVAAEGQGVQITLINGEGAAHDITIPEENAQSPRVTGKSASTTVAFVAGAPGDYVYFCSLPGHRLAGMEGKYTVTAKPPVRTVAQADISRDAADVPPPIGKREPKTVRVDLAAVELEGRLADDTTFGFWTFNGKVPGPMLRVRVGDTVDVHLKNDANSSMIHSVDFHAATGPGGGAASLQVDPGSEKSMKFKALVPGLYVYHCATPMVAEHIANGMYGMILVEPEEGLPKVDHEFYVMQGEIYTDAPFGRHGAQEFSVEKLLDEHPEYFVFNGSVGALSVLHPLHAEVGQQVRIFFGVGGPNFTSSFHVIGEIFDKVYPAGSLLSPPMRGVQTISVPPGSAAMVEFTPRVPGNYTLVDHALARVERGLVGVLNVAGTPNPSIYDGKVMPGMGH